jgi:hypothetical protein
MVANLLSVNWTFINPSLISLSDYWIERLRQLNLLLITFSIDKKVIKKPKLNINASLNRPPKSPWSN